MSRIGKAPILIDKSIQVTINGDEVLVKGGKSTERVVMRPAITAQMEEDRLVLKRKDDSKTSKSLHGLYRSLLQNAVTGVSKGFSKSLELVGVGYRAGVKGKTLELTLGYSHPISYNIPDGIEIKVDKQTTVHITGSNKQLVGQVAAQIRDYRPPEPFLGKGVKYTDEHIRRKAGKSAGK